MLKKVLLSFISLVFSQTLWADLQVQVQSTKGKRLGGAVVYAVPVGEVPASKTRTHIINQAGEAYEPRVLAVRKGDSLVIRNSDAVKHHSYSFSETKTFSTDLQEKGELKPMVMDSLGEAIIGCNIHDWMVSYVLVVDTPYYVVTNKVGRGLIKKMPKGKYKIYAYHPSAIDKSASFIKKVNFTGKSRVELAISVKKKGL